jgi:hypothetical protein
MAQADEIIHQQTRLKIMATLRPIPQGEWMEFARLKAILQATDGNLGSHIATLAGAGYIGSPRISSARSRVRAWP